jgi:hypothetical protein
MCEQWQASEQECVSCYFFENGLRAGTSPMERLGSVIITKTSKGTVHGFASRYYTYKLIKLIKKSENAYIFLILLHQCIKFQI